MTKKKKEKCGFCRKTGHTTDACPERAKRRELMEGRVNQGRGGSSSRLKRPFMGQ